MEKTLPHWQICWVGSISARLGPFPADGLLRRIKRGLLSHSKEQPGDLSWFSLSLFSEYIRNAEAMDKLAPGVNSNQTCFMVLK